MTDSSQSEVELELYEEIIDMNYSMPVASRTSSPLPYDENESYMTHFNGPFVNSSESEAVSTYTELVASVRHVAGSEIFMLASRQLSRATAAEASGRKHARDMTLKVVHQFQSFWNASRLQQGKQANGKSYITKIPEFPPPQAWHTL